MYTFVKNQINSIIIHLGISKSILMLFASWAVTPLLHVCASLMHHIVVSRLDICPDVCTWEAKLAKSRLTDVNPDAHQKVKMYLKLACVQEEEEG